MTCIQTYPSHWQCLPALLADSASSCVQPNGATAVLLSHPDLKGPTEALVLPITSAQKKSSGIWVPQKRGQINTTHNFGGGYIFWEMINYLPFWVCPLLSYPCPYPQPQPQSQYWIDGSINQPLKPSSGPPNSPTRSKLLQLGKLVMKCDGQGGVHTPIPVITRSLGMDLQRDFPEKRNRICYWQ